MDPTARFFNKLRKLAVTLETETTKLQEKFENRNKDEEDADSSVRAMRAYHELNSDVGNLKGQIQDQLVQQQAKESEVSRFINACRVMEDRVSEDLNNIKTQWEKYGYRDNRAPRNTQKTTSPDLDAEGDEAEKGEEEEESHEARGDNTDSPPPSNPGPAAFTDALRTPQLSDFGLSDFQLKKALAGCTEAPPPPAMILPHPSLTTPPPVLLTPKLALRMDDEELLMPQMHDFGISEHTMCLNNDFTRDLFKKNVRPPQRPTLGMPEPAVTSLMESLKSKADTLESPEPPVICTPGFKIKKTQCTPAAKGNNDPQSPCGPANLPHTPEVPTFQTPYVNRMVSTKKSGRKPEAMDMQADDLNQSLDLPSHTTKGATGSKRPWGYDVPDLSITGAEEEQMPTMPDLESNLGNSLQNRKAKVQKKDSHHEGPSKEPTVTSLELDGPTQEFNLGTPRVRTEYQEPSTPEMPDLSSVTQDICKLFSEAQSKKKTMAVVHPNIRPEHYKNRAASLSVVSDSEFHSLPGYLKQMTVDNLNQAIHNINKHVAECRGETTELQVEELRRITGTGTKTPVYILCLTELMRLTHTKGARNTSVYKLNTHS